MNSRDELIERLKNETKVLGNPLIHRAFEVVDRKDFVDPDYQIEAYEDYPLPIGNEQTISQPTTVAFMLEKLDAQEGDRVLDVGSGSGWTTALLSEIVGRDGEVIGVERIPELVHRGSENLSKYNFENAHIEQSGEKIGKEETSPYDRILVSASAEDESLAEKLLLQLKAPGKLVMPIGETISVFEKQETGAVTRTDFPGFVFVPLVS